MLAPGTVTSRHWFRLAAEESMVPLELRDGAIALPIWAPWDHSAQVPVMRHGARRIVIICCGPGAHLPGLSRSGGMDRQ